MCNKGLSEEKGWDVEGLKEWIEVNRICVRQIKDVRLSQRLVMETL